MKDETLLIGYKISIIFIDLLPPIYLSRLQHCSKIQQIPDSAKSRVDQFCFWHNLLLIGLRMQT